MGFQINPEEFEVTENNKKTDINFEIADVIQQVAFLKERYKDRIKAVRQRKKNLMQSIKVFVMTAIAFIFLAVLLLIIIAGSSEALVFVIWAVILFVIISVIVSINAARVVRSYCIHNGTIPNKSVYTLKMEEQDLQHFKNRLENIEERLKHFLEQEKGDEGAGRLLLDEVLPQLQEEERRADCLYGEILRM